MIFVQTGVVRKNIERMARHNFKITLVGDGEVGKSAWVSRLLGCDFENEYVATLGVEVHPISYNCSDGSWVKFNIWDCAGVEEYGGLRDGYYICSQGAIAMCDLTRRETCDNVATWHRDVLRLCENIPVVVCGNKTDSEDMCVRTEEGELRGTHFCSMSVASGENVHKPLLILARKLLRNETLEFV